MSYVTINDKEYPIPEMSFDAVCELEENGVELLSMNSRHPKLATTLRGLVAWVMGTDAATASREISAHISKGGNIMDILNPITDEMGKTGFFKRDADTDKKVKKYPQDHKSKSQKNTNRSQS